MRLLSAEAKVPLHHMRAGSLSDEDWSKLARRMGEIADAPLYIDDSPNMTMMEIRAKARRLKQRNDLKLVVVDYLQLMTSGKRVESRQQEVSEFSRALKLLAKELEVPVIAMSQLNRGSEQRHGQEADAVRPPRVRLDRAGRRHGHADPPRGHVREGVPAGRRGRHHAGQAPQRPHRRTSRSPSRATTAASSTWPTDWSGSTPPERPTEADGEGLEPAAGARWRERSGPPSVRGRRGQRRLIRRRRRTSAARASPREALELPGDAEGAGGAVPPGPPRGGDGLAGPTRRRAPFRRTTPRPAGALGVAAISATTTSPARRPPRGRERRRPLPPRQCGAPRPRTAETLRVRGAPARPAGTARALSPSSRASSRRGAGSPSAPGWAGSWAGRPPAGSEPRSREDGRCPTSARNTPRPRQWAASRRPQLAKSVPSWNSTRPAETAASPAQAMTASIGRGQRNAVAPPRPRVRGAGPKTSSWTASIVATPASSSRGQPHAVGRRGRSRSAIGDHEHLHRLRVSPAARSRWGRSARSCE